MLLSDIFEIMGEDLLLDFMSWLYPVIWLMTSGLSIAAYVLSSLALYRIAEKRNIKKGWLAWVPFGANWILGSISDQYQYVVKGKNKSKRKLLLFCEILLFVVVIAFFVLLIAGIISLEPGPPEEFSPGVDSPYTWHLLIASLVVWLAMEITSVVMLVIRYMALFDVYRSCNPKTAEVFLVFSIMAGWIPCGVLLEPIFLFLNRKKEAGMPPRKGAEPVVEVVAAPEEAPAEEPAVEPITEEAPVEEPPAEETTEE